MWNRYATNETMKITSRSGIDKTLLNKVFKNGPSKICGRQPLNNLKGYGLLKQRYLLFGIKK